MYDTIGKIVSGFTANVKVLNFSLQEGEDISDVLERGLDKNKFNKIMDNGITWHENYFEENVNPPECNKLNEDHAVVTVGNKVQVMQEYIDPVFKRPDIRFLSIPDFKNKFSNRFIDNPKAEKGQPKKINIATAWLRSPSRRQFEGIVFEPGKNIENHYNLYSGLQVEPKEGDWDLFKNHILEVICNNDKSIFEYVIAWLARIVQDPGGDRPGVAIALRGGRGIGKGVFVSQYGKLFGLHYLPITNGKHITGRFNHHHKNALLLFSDEAVWGGEKIQEGVLKGLITEKEIMCEPKGKDPFPIKNHVNLILASNNEWFVPAGIDERRFLVLDVSERYKQNSKHFAKIIAQMDNGGREAMLYDLMRVDWRKHNLRKAPNTKALLAQIELAMNPIENWWYNRLKDGTTIYSDRLWSEKKTYGTRPLTKCKYAEPELIKTCQNRWKHLVIISVIYEDYKMFAKELGQKYIDPPNTFGRKLRKLCPKIPPSRQQKIDKKNTVKIYRMPPLEVCRKEFERKLNKEIDWNS